MSKLLLLTGFSVLFCVVLVIALYPFRRNRYGLCVLILLCIAGVSGLYWHWGGWSEWMRYLESSARQQQVQTILKTAHGVDELIEKLKEKLAKHRKSARGWYLLGRLYAHQNQWDNAQRAFETAYTLKPNDEAIVINLAQSQWQLNHQSFNESTRKLLKSLLAKNNNQADALSMLAMDAYTNHAYAQAIEYWQRLLVLMPKQSDEAKFIRKAIVKAQQAMSDRIQK